MRFVGFKEFGSEAAGASPASPNYFVPPIRDQWHSLVALAITPPWLPGLVQALVHVFVLLLLAVLAVSFGTFNQIWETLFRLASEHGAKAQNEPHAVAKSAHAATAGIFLAFGTPFFIVNAPFEAIGLGWSRLRGQEAASEPLTGRLVGVGVISLFAFLWRLGAVPYIGDGVAWAWTVATGVGGADVPLTNMTSGENLTSRG